MAKGDVNVSLISLQAIDGPMKNEYFIIKSDQSFIIGRSKKANVCIPQDPYVSRIHAKVLLHNGKMIIEDTGSKNGTYLNDQLLNGKKDLKIGDEIKIGSSLLRVIKM